jgi:glutathione S-transferase
MRILGRATSINVQKVAWLCAELGLDVERVDVGGHFGGNDRPEFLAKNPNGLVPVLEDGDFVLWESHSIVRYLAETVGGDPWFPKDVRQRALANQWMDWTLATLIPAFNPIFWQLIRTAPDQRDHALVARQKPLSERLFRILDAQLAKAPYVIGDQPTMADIPLGAAVYRWLHLPIERPSLPGVEGYFQRLAERPAYHRHVMLPLT